MNKNSFAISFALVGVGVAMWLAVDLDWNYTIAAIVGGCAGGFVGFLVAGFRSAKGTILQQNFQALGTLTGLSLEEIESKCGKSTSFSTCVIEDRDNAPGFFYTWAESNYSITLLFDEDKKCIGVSNETGINQ
ncbi:MAG: hypothetical protein J5808_01580 [Paludibacteraceae bacterium]|jgi:hypothetical protein|nr:hypothetical protein [Paludibacteraceae bacterium]